MILSFAVAVALCGAPKVGGLWEARNNQLYGSYGNAPVELVQPFSVTLNSSGSPIINALGKEYMRCN